jgi:hypothetical protein
MEHVYIILVVPVLRRILYKGLLCILQPLYEQCTETFICIYFLKNFYYSFSVLLCVSLKFPLDISVLNNTLSTYQKQMCFILHSPLFVLSICLGQYSTTKFKNTHTHFRSV